MRVVFVRTLLVRFGFGCAYFAGLHRSIRKKEKYEEELDISIWKESIDQNLSSMYLFERARINTRREGCHVRDGVV
jgi:phosphopantetheine adenylyltransferase